MVQIWVRYCLAETAWTARSQRGKHLDRMEKEVTMKQLSLLLVTVGLNVIGQYLMKRGMSDMGAITGTIGEMAQHLARAFLNPWVIGGLGAYGFSTFCWLILLSRVDLSYAYPALSLGYVLITIVGFFVLGEAVSPMRWAAVLIICVGVFLVSQS